MPSRPAIRPFRGHVPRPKTDAHYAVRVESLAAEGQRPPTIAKVIEREARKAGRTDWPSERTVRRLYEAWKQRPEEERREAEQCRWPQSMLAGALPWEASAAVLELLRFRDERGLERPTVRVAQWFYRLRLATRDYYPTEVVAVVAESLAFSEYSRVRFGSTIEMTDLDLLLAYGIGQPSPGAVRRMETLAERVTLTAPSFAPITAQANLIRTALVERAKELGLESEPAPVVETAATADGPAQGQRGVAGKKGRRKT